MFLVQFTQQILNIISTSSFLYPCSLVTMLSVSASDLGDRVSILLAVSYVHPFSVSDV
jgi:hypothetical protein